MKYDAFRKYHFIHIESNDGSVVKGIHHHLYSVSFFNYEGCQILLLRSGPLGHNSEKIPIDKPEVFDYTI